MIRLTSSGCELLLLLLEVPDLIFSLNKNSSNYGIYIISQISKCLHLTAVWWGRKDRIIAALYSHKYSRLYETDNDKVRTRANLLIAMLYYLHKFFRKYYQKYSMKKRIKKKSHHCFESQQLSDCYHLHPYFLLFLYLDQSHHHPKSK